jgi:hypothetical protein
MFKDYSKLFDEHSHHSLWARQNKQKTKAEAVSKEQV